MAVRSLPLRPNLEQLKRQAHELHRLQRDGHPSAAARIATHHSEMKGRSAREILDGPFALADALLVIAREYGFENWTQLKQRVALGPTLDQTPRHPRFDEALDAHDRGDVEQLRRLLAADPALIRARTHLDPPYGYFTGATLLHHVAGNPGRDRPLPPNIVDVARVLVEAGADANALTLGPSPSISPETRGSTTMGLVITSKQASDMNVTGALMDLLLEYGAHLDLSGDDTLDASLANHAPRAAEKMIELGVTPDLLHAAALGRIDLLKTFFSADGHLIGRPRRRGRELSDRDAIGLALLYGYVRHQREAVEFLLEKDGDWDVTGVNNGTALHRAAWSGDLDIVKRLVARGADIGNRDNPFFGTPMDWAHHNRQFEVVRWIQANCRVDLFSAAAYGLRDHVEARLREDAASVNSGTPDQELARAMPLHAAARANHADIAVLLYQRGAARDALAGNGMTPLDVAYEHKAAAAIAALEERGARRSADAPSLAQIRAQPAYRIDEKGQMLEVRPLLNDDEWEGVLAVVAERRIPGLNAGGKMTDGLIEQVSKLVHLTNLDLGGSRLLTDAGAKHLARLERLERLWLAGTSTGNGALAAVAGKSRLRVLGCGVNVTEDGLRHLHDVPWFKTWQGGERRYRLMEFEAEPTYLLVHPAHPLPSASLQALVGLDGLFALNLDNPSWKRAELAPLKELPNLGWLGFDADDESMKTIGELPGLRFLMAQDTVAGDDGFVALGRSTTLEYIWGRRCYNLRGRGFRALSRIPSLRGLSVSCRNVEDDALSALPEFPALRELMPMDVQDSGFKHVGRCTHLEALWCMYCRDTTDVATEFIRGLDRLKTYYAGRTKITDRSLEILAAMHSLEKLEFWNCDGITTRGIAGLAVLPRLRELVVDGCRDVTEDAASAFSEDVRVRITT